MKEAREKAALIRQKIRDGKNPAEKAAPKDHGVTFGVVAEDWAGRFLVLSQRAPATIKKMRLFLDKHILPVIGSAPIKSIDSPTILNQLLRPIESRGQLETAHRAKGLCSQIFRFAVATGQADRDPTQDLRGAVPPQNVKHRSSFVDPSRISQLLKDIHNYTGHVVTRHALKMLPYVFVRPGELRHAEWSEIDFSEKLWRIPPEKMKKVKFSIPHLVPLSNQVITVLESLKEYTGANKYLFPGQRGNDRPLSDMAINAALRYLGYSGDDITGHGFRSMASTILNEKGYNLYKKAVIY